MLFPKCLSSMPPSLSLQSLSLSSPSNQYVSPSRLSMTPLWSSYFHSCPSTCNSPHSTQRDLIIIQSWYVTPTFIPSNCFPWLSDKWEILSVALNASHSLAPTYLSSTSCSLRTSTFPHFLSGAMFTSYGRNFTLRAHSVECSSSTLWSLLQGLLSDLTRAVLLLHSLVSIMSFLSKPYHTYLFLFVWLFD